MAEVSIVIVTWNSEDELGGLLASIDEHLGDENEVIIVDNASSDASVRIARAWRGNKVLIELAENVGFGAAANAGVRAAQHEAVVLLNPDTLLVDGSLVTLAKVAARQRALYGPELLNEDGSRQPSASARPGGWEVGLDAVAPARLLPRRLRVRCEPWRARDRVTVGWLTGACIAAPRSLLLDLGPFDESLHLYGEDLDLGMRAVRANIPSVFAPELARVVHFGNRSAQKRFRDAGVARKLENRRAVLRKLSPGRARYDFVSQLVFHAARFVAKTLMRRSAAPERTWLKAVYANRSQNGQALAGREARARVARAFSVADVHTFIREVALLFVTLGLLNGSNYAFHVVAGRALGPEDYGALAALLAIVMVISVPLGVLQTVVAQRTATLHAQGRHTEIDRLAGGAFSTLLPVALLGGAFVTVAVAPVLSSLLNVELIAAALIGPYILISALATVTTGVLQGQQRFVALSLAMLAGVTTRLTVGIALIMGGFGITGAILATAIAPLATLIAGAGLLRIPITALRGTMNMVRPLRSGTTVAALSLTSFWLLAEVDLALARHFLDEREAGYYSSAGMLARTLLFLPAAVSIVAFPRFVAAREQGQGHSKWLALGLIGTVVLVAPALGVVLLFREPLVTAVFGDAYAPAVDVLPAAALAMGSLAIVALLVYFHIAMRTRAWIVLLGGLAIEVAAVSRYHESAVQIATVTAVVAAIVLVLQFQTARSVCRWRPTIASPATDPARGVTLASEPQVELSIVLPCHNAGPALRDVLAGLVAQTRRLGSSEIIVVSDGSTDDTFDIASEFSSSNVRVLEYPLRGGKGHALRLGLTDARGTYVAFFDADGDIGVEAIGSFLALMNLYRPDVVLGSKRHPLSAVQYPRSRRTLSWAYHKLTRILFHIDVRDTQTGAKLIRRDVLAAVLPRLLEKRYAFDLEFLVVARSLGYRRILEAPVRIDYKFASHVDPRAVVRIGLDTLAIGYRHYVLNTYRSPAWPVTRHDEGDAATTSPAVATIEIAATATNR